MIKADIHIDIFYKDVARTLVRLYESFPNKIILYVDEIAGEDQPDEFGLHSPRYLAGFSTLIWLAEEGFLRFTDTIKQDALDQTVLSQSSFFLLSSAADIPHNETISALETMAHRRINQLREALHSGSSFHIEQQVMALLALTQEGK